MHNNKNLINFPIVLKLDVEFGINEVIIFVWIESQSQSIIDHRAQKDVQES